MPAACRSLLVLAAGFAASAASCATPARPPEPPAETTPVTPSTPPPATTTAAPEAAKGPLQVAITVDDLPRHGPPVRGVTDLEIHRRLLTAFAAHDVPQVYGFVNAQKLEAAPELRSALEAWTEAGHPLGNHTFTHPSLRAMSVDDFYVDIAKNEPLLDELALDGRRVPTFRYPFLLEGMTRQDTLDIRAHLLERGYRIAPVTIDFYDWAFNPPYARCVAQNNEAAIEALRETFLLHALEMLDWADAAALDLYGRRVPHVMLLHSGSFAAEMIEPLLVAMEKRGVRWVPLDTALADPIYADLPVHDGRNQGTLLDMAIDAGGAPHPPWNMHPDALLAVLCTNPS